MQARVISLDNVELLAKSPGLPSTMVLEDDAEWRAALVSSLRQAGFEVTAFNAVEDAVEHLLAHTPELVSLDLELPRVLGGNWQITKMRYRFLGELRLVCTARR